MDNLTPDQLRFLQAKIDVHLRSNPVEKMPFELCYQIFEHLEAYQIFQAQRVSCKWYRILSSPEIVEPLALRPLFGDLDTSSPTSKGLLHGALPIPDGFSPSAAASFHARHVHSFRNGTALSMAMGQWQPQGYENRYPSRVCFAGCILAWTDWQIGCIQLECLISRVRVSLFTPMREEVCRIAISDLSIVAITLSGKCYAWDLSVEIRNLKGRSRRCIETHVAQADSMVISRMTVAILHDSSKEMVNVTTWDIRRRRLHHFRIEINPGAFPDLYDYFAIIAPGEKSIVFFERVFDHSNYARFTRTDLKGQLESSGCIEHPDIDGYRKHSEYTAPACMIGCVTLWSYAADRQVLNAQQIYTKTWEISWEIIRVVYDTRADRLELQRHIVEDKVRTRISKTDFFWWKDVAYIENTVNGHEELEVLDLKASVCKKAEMSASTLFPKTLERHVFDVGYGWHRGFFLGNESFLISVRYVRSIISSHRRMLHSVEHRCLVC